VRPSPVRNAILALVLLASIPSAAQERHKEEELFGAPAPGGQGEAPAPAGVRPSEAEVFGKPASEGGEAVGRSAAEGRLQAELGKSDDPLKLGGLLYLRSNLSATEEGPPSRWAFTAPALLDVFLDARPSERLRGFVLARTTYDSTQPRSGVAYQLRSPLSPAAAGLANPRGTLDQLWLRFDAGNTLFFTVGRQHVKWGVGRFWSPTDFLHVARRDPLAPFDERAGTTMLKLHLPWEKQGWNLYAVAVAEALAPSAALAGLQGRPEPPNELGAVGGGGRAEVVLGSWEIGLDGVAQRGLRPRLGIDASTGFWEIDVRGELALRRGADLPRLRNQGSAGSPDYLLEKVRATRTAAVLSADWQHKYSDEDTFTLGAEYFWNGDGYGDAGLYLPLLAAQLGTPFYLGQHYGALFVRLPQPGAWNLHAFGLSALANLSDRSFQVRLDWSVTLLTYLTLEAYLVGHGGPKGGEFRFGFDQAGKVVRLPAELVPLCTRLGGSANGASCTLPNPFQQAAPLFDAGLALRIAL